MAPKGPKLGDGARGWSLHLMGDWAGGKRVACACPLVTTYGDRPDGRLLWSRRPAPRKEVEYRNARQNYQASASRTFQIIGERVVKKCRGNQHKHRWNHRISPHTIGPLGLRVPSTENEHRAARDHVEHPLRKNRKREELPETASQQQQYDCEPALHNDRHRRCAEARMDLRHRLEKISIARHRKRHTG